MRSARQQAIRTIAAVVLAAAAVCGCAPEDTGRPDGEADGAGPTTASPRASGTPRAHAEAGEPRVVASDLEVPWGIGFLPGGDALVTERDSTRVLRVTASGDVSVVATIGEAQPRGEGGLLGLAVSPGFAEDRRVYLYYTAADDNRIVRFRYQQGELRDKEVLVSGIPAASIHNGGRLVFGPDDLLYASTGEAGRSSLAQDRGSLGGKILRMTPEGEPAPDNPFGDSLVYSYGHRNVQGLAFGPDGRLYATEFGANAYDEINLIRPGNNYGWPEVEGVGDGDRFTDPLLTWRPAEASPAGAEVAGGNLWVGALRGARLWRVPLAGDGSVGEAEAVFTDEYGRLRSVIRSPGGPLWVTTSNRDGRGDPASGDDKILAVPLGS